MQAAAPELPEMRRAAIEAATAAGAILRASFGKTTEIDETAAHDLKLRVDRTCEDRILAVIRREFPRHAVLSEEMGYAPGLEPFLWIVDPLDGTVNFFHGIPFFCTCVSCHPIEEGDALHAVPRLPDGRGIGDARVSVVYSPVAKELYVATPGAGAFLNGAPLHVDPLASLSQAMVSLSFSARDRSLPYMSRLMPLMVERAQKVRSLGSTALEIVHIAAGRSGAFVQMGTNPWDFLAGASILKEAGGVVRADEYIPGRWKVIAANPGIFADVLKLAEP